MSIVAFARLCLILPLFFTSGCATYLGHHLPNSEVVDSIKAMDKKGAAHVMVVSDSCFSGALLDKRDARGMGVRPAKADEASTWLTKVARRTRPCRTGGKRPGIRSSRTRWLRC